MRSIGKAQRDGGDELLKLRSCKTGDLLPARDVGTSMV